MKLIPKFLYRSGSAALFRVLKFADRNLWVPGKVSETLAFREHWQSLTPAHAVSKPMKLWIHGASVGELEELAAFFLSTEAMASAGLKPADMMITASSVSAAERLKKWQSRMGFGYCGPLPPDTSSECAKFLAIFKPENILLSHNDFWPNLFFAWRKQKNSKTFYWYLKPKIFGSERLSGFESMKPVRVERKLIGNLRLDRIKSRVANAKSAPHVLEDFQAVPNAQKPSIIVGSCRVEDARLIAQLPAEVATAYHWVAIPHNTEEIGEVAQISDILGGRASIVAKQGILVEAYRDFDLAWIGGGFSRSGSHNSLEALAWGVPVISGPHTAPQVDTPDFEASGALRTLSDLEAVKTFLHQESWRSMKSSALALSQRLEAQSSSVQNLINLLKKAQ